MGLVRQSLAPYRLAAQRLAGRALATPEAVVAHLGAVQAQEHLMAPWAVGRRCGATLKDVTASFNRRDFVRTHVLRTTWHYVLMDDLPDLLAVTGHRVRRLVEQHCRGIGLDAAALRDGADAVAQIVRSHGPVTRPVLGEHLAAGGLSHTGRALTHVVMYAELDGTIASGPIQGKQHTYQAVELAPTTRDEDELLAWLAGTYGRGHGPFTPQDLAWWSSLTLTQARRAVELADLEEIQVDGQVLHAPPGLEPLEVPHVLLLANFDELISHARDAEIRAEVGPDYDDIMMSTGLLFVDGRLSGRWRRRTAAEHVDIEVHPSGRLEAAARSALEAEADAFGTFLGLQPRLDITV
ncbi:winged helix DNA-binding domain-containing protein [Aeromicrobium sp. CTD01-1L150]|uniref:winged helix DNA-binding domain-containing protein n=1 Tax=Aeromicrobium sp. CTD01-1L150 TaxID=3341830 RepID=UPI0035C26DB9